jgi:hypothetical protein
LIADVASICPGKCYLTYAGQVRRIVEVLPDGRIGYQRRPAHRPDAEWQNAEQDLAAFANLAIREVPCDWTPEGDG